MNTINVENCKTLLIGRRGENEVTTVAFDFAEWQTEFGSGVVDLYVKRFGDDSAYPVVLTIDGTVASWLVTETDTNVAGYGKAEYVYRVDGKIAKSAVFPFFVAEDIGQPASEPPDPYESWLEQLTALGAETEANAQAAEQSAENAAQSAEDAAQSAASAEGHAGQAETAAGLAQAAQTASEAARDAAQTAQASAEASATVASDSADSAAGSATAAAGSASDASASASYAGASATTASTAATQAEAAKTAAQSAQTAAEQAAQQAHVEYEQLSGEVDDLSDEVSQQKSAIEALDSLVDRKAGMLVDTASGSIASFVPDSTIPDLLSVSVDIEPVQDLHGYDAPWPAGGSAQLLPTYTEDMTQDGITLKVNDDGSVTLNGTATATITFLAPTSTWQWDGIEECWLSGCPAGGNYQNSYSLRIDSAIDASYSYVDTGSGVKLASRTGSSIDSKPISFCIVIRNGTVCTNLTFKPMLNKGLSAQPFQPYENICPISGWDSVEVDTTGINVWDAQWEGGYYDISDGSAKASSSWQRSKKDIVCKPNTAYCARQEAARASLGYFLFYKEDGKYISSLTMTGNVPTIGQTFSTPSECRIIRIYRAVQNDGLGFSINYPATDHAYHPYAGNRYTIPLGQTIYGGTMTIAEDGSVEMLVDKAKDVYDGSADEIWQKSGTGTYVLTNTSVKGNTTPISNIYLMEKAPTSGFNIRPIGNDNFANVTAWKTFLSQNNLEVVYELATPIAIQLDPVTISTISGQPNNVWADAGDVSVEFAADLKHYIDSKIAAAVAALS